MQVGRPACEIPADLPDYPTIVHALDAAADDLPDRTALICEDKSVTFAQYRNAVAGMAGFLRGFCKKGDRASLIMANSIEMAVAEMGAFAAGLQGSPLNPNLTDREIIPLLTDVDPTVILCSPQFAKRARALAAEAGVPRVEIVGTNEGESGLDIWQWVDDDSQKLPADLPAPTDRAAIFITGGTTGQPKGAEHIHSSMIWFCRQTLPLWNFRFGAETILNVAPMFHIWGHHFTLVIPLYLRATQVIVPQYSPDFVIDQLVRHRVTIFAGGPAAIFLGLLASEKMPDADLSALKYSLAGGSPCPEGLLRRWYERTGNEIVEGWGMSEGAPINNNPTEGVKKRLSTGVTPPNTEIDIVDLETGTKVLPQGERGEIRVRGPQFTIGYRNRPEETANAIRDGWLYTGDIGYFDEDGYMFLVDRKKELVIVGGFNVFPREIDEVLVNHPAVVEAAAVGVPDDFSGEVIKAYVALAPGQTVSVDELMAYCKDNLVKYKVPKEIEILDELPKKGPGKIDKLKLKAMHATAVA